MRGAARLIVAALGLVIVASAAVLWLTTPTAADLEQQVAAVAAAEKVQMLKPSDVPELLARAVVAIEDERFYTHHGIDSIGLGRAVLTDARYACLCEGGSTITEQLADMAYYSGSGRGRRKLPSMTVALKIEEQNSKAQILADYVSIVPSGAGLTGMRSASCQFFHHGLDRLTVAEAAELGGMPQAPSAYDPRYHPEAAQHRRSAVLKRMQEQRYITESQRAEADQAPVVGSGVGC